MAVVVKRRGKKEEFDEKKVYASVYSACMECEMGEKKCEEISEHVVDELKKFLKGKKEVNSTEIFGFIIQKLAKKYEPAAFMYQTHRDLS
ncbi:MAG: ATP cone domain-containing protein [Candidatus Micrarchaeota archaeon]